MSRPHVKSYEDPNIKPDSALYPLPDGCLVAVPVELTMELHDLKLRIIERCLSVMNHLRPYINHHRSCYKGGNDNATVIECQCGLDSTMEALREKP